MNDRKNPGIRSLFQDNKVIADFKRKSTIFNFFSANWCYLADIRRTLTSLSLSFTNKSFSHVDFSIWDIDHIIITLCSNEVHSDNLIRIHMVKLWDKSIYELFSIILNLVLLKALSYQNGN